MESVDLEMEQGATFRASLLYQDANGDPIPTTDKRARMQVRYRPGEEILLDLSTENQGITFNPDGSIDLYGGATKTRNVEKDALYDLLLIDVNDEDEVDRVFGGKILLTKSVTIP